MCFYIIFETEVRTTSEQKMFPKTRIAPRTEFGKSIEIDQKLFLFLPVTVLSPPIILLVMHSSFNVPVYLRKILHEHRTYFVARRDPKRRDHHVPSGLLHNSWCPVVNQWLAIYLSQKAWLGSEMKLSTHSLSAL